MNILIRDASYQPLRKAQNATHFKVISMLPSGKPLYQPCAPSDPQGERKRMLDIPGEQLTLPPITIVKKKKFVEIIYLNRMILKFLY